MESLYKSDPNLRVLPAYYSGGVPVFKPTMDQFHDFYKFNKAINKYGMQSGIVKIVPPAEWTRLLEGTYTDENLSHIRIRNPIIQSMNVTAGHQGVYSLQNVERQRTYDIYQWKNLSQKANHVPPAHRKTRRGLPTGETSKSTERSTPSTQKLCGEILTGDFNIDVSEFSSDRCEELEHLYWKSLSYAEPMYGADVLGSIFKDSTKEWNVSHLPNVLDLMEEKLPGVNDAYLYAGLWKASFSWHLEDQDLYSINYLHFGAPKQWYSIPQKEHKRFHALMKDIFSEDYKNCHEFLRHKTFLASPQFLSKHGITCNKITHNQGEFMITYPYGYHAGFNYGYNLAESVNFALDDWFPFAEKTHKCECISDAVAINYRLIYSKFKGTPYKETDFDSLDKPRVPVKAVPETSISKPVAHKPLLRKRPKVEVSASECSLCPNILPSILKQRRPFELLPCAEVSDDRARMSIGVHRLCASMFPGQLAIEQSSSGSCNGDTVRGIDSISRAQKSLVCSVCHKRNLILTSAASPLHGACFQCSAPKCTRSFHATCAISAGFLFGKNVCKQHRKPYQFDSVMSRQKLTLRIKPGSLVQFGFPSWGAKRQTANVFAGMVICNNHMENTLEVLVYPQLAERMEVMYENLLFSDSGEATSAEISDQLVSEDTLSQFLPRSGSVDEPQALLSFRLDYPNYTTERLPASFPTGNQIVFINEFSNASIAMDRHPRIEFVNETFNDFL